MCTEPSSPPTRQVTGGQLEIAGKELDSGSRLRRWPIWLLLAIHTVMLGYTAVADSTTVDEPAHLAGGIRRWQNCLFDIDRGNPPLMSLVAALPVVFAGVETDWRRAPNVFDVGMDFMAANGERSFWLITLGRWACIVFSLLGAVVCYRWARDLYGHVAGLVALTLWCFGPNLIANGHLIKADVAATSVGLAAFYFFKAWLVAPSARSALVAGLLIGLAELTKYVWLILPPLCLLIWLLGLPWKRRDDQPRIPRQIGHLVLMAFAALYVVNLGYAYGGMFLPLGDYEVGRRIAAKGEWFLTTAGLMEDRGQPTWIHRIPVPLPEDYVGGIDEILQYTGQKPATYLRRQWRDGGWAYYYPYAMLIKLPLGTLGLLLLACAMRIRKFSRAVDWRNELLLLVPLMGILGFVSLTGASQKLRYALPALPFLLIWISSTGQLLTRKERSPSLLVLALLTWSVTSSMLVFPHSLSYFNELAGGPKGGQRHLLDSDIDWGQDLFYLKRWWSRHPEARPLGVASQWLITQNLALGTQDIVDVPLFGPDGGAPLRMGPQPGWYAVGMNWLRGRNAAATYFLQFRPVDYAGYSIYVYHLELPEVNRVRQEMRLPLLPAVSRPPETNAKQSLRPASSRHAVVTRR